MNRDIRREGRIEGAGTRGIEGAGTCGIEGTGTGFYKIAKTVYLIVLYPEKGSIAETSVKQLLTASKFSFLI